MLFRSEAALLSALQADLGKSPMQGYATEIGLVQAEIRHAQKHLGRWAAPQRRRTPWFVAPARGWVQSEPFGVALILGPWNYPVQLLLTPLVSAIAAGNCAVLKPSELAPRTAEIIATLVRETFAKDFISVVTGGPDVAEALLAERFDKIFFTGSARMLRDRIARALPAWDASMPAYHAILGMHAFGLEEMGDYAQAEAQGRRGVVQQTTVVLPHGFHRAPQGDGFHPIGLELGHAGVRLRIALLTQ